LPLWQQIKEQRGVVAFDLEVTARCNNNCRHCYINIPACSAQARELSLSQIKSIVDQATDLGALWCLITGGEPLLREDFPDIYVYMKRKGLLISVFTNATLLTQEHIALFKRYPPREIEVTVYGISQETYESVTRVRGSFNAFMSGLDLLARNKIKVRCKAMALRSNVHELPQMAAFCRLRTKDYFRFDPFLHLRLDGDEQRNAEIKSERLSPQEIVMIEQADSERFNILAKNCHALINPDLAHRHCRRIFHCGVGKSSFSVSCDGKFRLCSSLSHPECVYDLAKGTLMDAWNSLRPRVLAMESHNENFLEKCHQCPIVNLCYWCPAKAYLETGSLDEQVEYFCSVAHARKSMLQGASRNVITDKLWNS
ncbi:MAG: radical SAM protein, partial [Candidatus Omnitrophica bacterium]|nr:radical SAM protein [Candidatus Omnitrophota bacterium]